MFVTQKCGTGNTPKSNIKEFVQITSPQSNFYGTNVPSLFLQLLAQNFTKRHTSNLANFLFKPSYVMVGTELRSRLDTE